VSDELECTASKQKRFRLRVKIVSAKDLIAGDINGYSDPYCICEIAGRKEARFQTDVIQKTLDPVWQQEHIFEACALDDELNFHVYDYDGGKKLGDFLGRAVLESDDIFPDGFSGELVLEMDSGANSSDNIVATRSSRISMSLGLSGSRKKSRPPTPSLLTVKVDVLPMVIKLGDAPRLFVKVIRAENLRAV